MSSSPRPRPGWRPRVRDDVVFRKVGDDWILFDAEAQRIHVLNLTAALVWSFCTGEADVASIEAQVREAFGIADRDPEVKEALEEFRRAGLLAGEPAPEP